MWGRDRSEQVTCIACGDSIFRSDAREYDKFGDRFDRIGKQFEYLCKPCYRELCHQPRGELEALLVDMDDGSDDGSDVGHDEFLRRYYETVADRYESGDVNEPTDPD